MANVAELKREQAVRREEIATRLPAPVAMPEEITRLTLSKIHPEIKKNSQQEEDRRSQLRIAQNANVKNDHERGSSAVFLFGPLYLTWKQVRSMFSFIPASQIKLLTAQAFSADPQARFEALERMGLAHRRRRPKDSEDRHDSQDSIDDDYSVLNILVATMNNQRSPFSAIPALFMKAKQGLGLWRLKATNAITSEVQSLKVAAMTRNPFHHTMAATN